MKIVVGIIEFENKVLFIKRVKEPFKDTLILPGGKVDNGETLDQALEREIFEETGLYIKTKEPIGYYDESVYIDGKLAYRHDITIYHVIPRTFDYRDSKEGQVFEIDILNIQNLRSEINPSDLRMLERFFIQKQIGFKAKINVAKLENRYEILSEEDY